MNPIPQTTRKIIAIVAMDEGRIIGNKGGLPWHYPEDMKRFSTLTRANIVLMGRKTYQSLPDKFRPLPGRRNIVISRTVETLPGAEVFPNLGAALAMLGKSPGLAILWIIGGAEIYKETESLWHEVIVTRVPGNHEGDVSFPKFEDRFDLVSSEEGGEGLRFERYVRRK